MDDSESSIDYETLGPVMPSNKRSDAEVIKLTLYLIESKQIISCVKCGVR